jgi:hypothetical protein
LYDGTAVPRTSSRRTCESSVAPRGNCTIAIAFKSKATGAQAGTAAIQEFNADGPLTIALIGVGD